MRTQLTILSCVLALFGSKPTALAQEADTAGDREVDFEALVARLDEAEQSYRYAQRALAAGDIRSAISSLERVLQLDPSLSNIKYELGLLYLEVGQAELATVYLEDALRDPSMPRDLRRNAQQALLRAGRDQSRQRFAGFLTGGLRWDDNPRAVTDSLVLLNFTGDVIRSEPNEDRSSEASLALGAGFESGFVLAEQMGHELVIDGGINWNKYESSARWPESVPGKCVATYRFHPALRVRDDCQLRRRRPVRCHRGRCRVAFRSFAATVHQSQG